MNKYCSNCGYKFEKWDKDSCPLCYSTKWTYRKESSQNSSKNGKKIGIGAGIVIAIVLVGFFFVALSLRLILIKGGEFKGTCASQNPYLNPKGEECGYCGKTVTPGTDCKKG